MVSSAADATPRHAIAIAIAIAMLPSVAVAKPLQLPLPPPPHTPPPPPPPDAVASNIIEGVLDGYNGALLAYGQTGSGKTHSMRGAEGAAYPDPDTGVIPRALAQLLETREQLRKESGIEITLEASYVQIYCEMLQDLLEPSNSNMSVREKADGRVYVEGLSRVPVTSLNQCLELLREGDNNRAVASTNMNASSSRSHACWIVHVERRERVHGDTEGVLITSTLTMVDLAGSERVKRSGVQYQQLEETKAINLSLSALGNCVSALAQGRKHVPYRDSKLTRLLCQSLGGNARTAMLVNVAPGGDSAGETLCSLNFAQRASRVEVSAVRNETVDYAKLYASTQSALDSKDDAIHALELEVATLTQKLQAAEVACDRAAEGRAAAEAHMKRTEAGFSVSVQALQDASADPGGDRAIAAVETVNDKWRKEIDALQREHEEQVETMQARWERQLDAYKSAAAHANEEWNTVETELSQEREGYLETLTKYKEARQRIGAVEKESSDRIAELLADLSNRDAREAELHEALDSARRTAEMSLEKAGTMAGRVETLEAQHKEQIDTLSNDYVSREQVVAMENLFQETVDRLAARLAAMEDKQEDLATGQKLDRGTMDGRSRKILEDMESNTMMGSITGTGRRRRASPPEETKRGGREDRERSSARGMNVSGGGVSSTQRGEARGIRIQPGRVRAGGAGAGPGGAGGRALPERRRF